MTMRREGTGFPRVLRGSIARQIVLLLLAFAILPMLVLAGLVFVINGSVHHADMARTQRDAADRLAQAVQIQIQGSLNSLQLLGASLDPEGQDPSRLSHVLSGFLTHQSEFEAVTLARVDGTAILHESRLRDLLEGSGETLDDRKEFQQALQGRVVVGEARRAPASRLPELRLYVPFQGRHDQVVGVVRATMSISRMWQLIARSCTVKGATAYIVDREGALIASDDGAAMLEGRNMKGMVAVERFLAGEGGVWEYSGIQATPVVGVVAETPLTRWGVVVETPLETVYSHAHHIGWALGAASLLLVLFTGFFGWMFSVRALLRPILSLQNDVRVIATGDLTHRISLDRHDELGSLAADLSVMAESLRSLTVSKEMLTLENQERQKTEVALRENERRLADILNFLPDATLAIDREKRVIIWNRAIEKMTGVPSEAMLGSGSYEYTIPFYGERRPQLMDLIWEPDEDLAARYPHIRRDGSSYEAEAFCPALYGGKGAWVFLKASPLHDQQGSIVGAIESIRDITDHKQADEALQRSAERLRSLIDAAPFGAHLYELDEGDRLVFRGYNRSAERILGLDNARFLGRTIEEAFPPLALTDIPERYRRVAAGGEVFESSQVDYQHDGISGVFEVHGFQAAPRWMAAFFTDITERRRAEAEREKLQAQLIQAQKMESVGRLAGGVAHDFNNKIQAILGYTSLCLSETPPESQTHQWLQEIEMAAEQSAGLTRQLLAFARKQTIRVRVLDLNETITGMLKMIQRLVGEDITLEWMGGEGLWKVRMDPAQIDQIVANLVVNSRDAISGTGIIRLETRNVSLDSAFCDEHAGAAPGQYVVLTVSDTGCGMSGDTLGSIFEPFFTTKELGKGTGLGLATVYGIVKQNGGFLEVRSQPGQGATFMIHLPRHEGGETEDGLAPSDDEPRGGRETVLIVEDEEAIIALGRAILQRLGYRVLTAGTPQEAMRLVGDHPAPIHLLITDVVMPEMNGRELADGLIRMKPDMKCLFMSGYTADVIAHRGVLDEGIHFIQKPFSVKDLSEAVRKILEE
jgi:PAS domain S-box-containing protein